MSLSATQLTAIDQHLRKENWLLNEDLIAELKDHYINGLEERLAQGMAFEVAMREIQRGFGGRSGLLALEEEKNRSRTPIIARQLRQLIGSYFRPPRLSVTLLLMGVAYWCAGKELVGNWLEWAHISFFLVSTIPIITLGIRNGFLYVAGKRESMKEFMAVFYRYILAVNLLNILNFLWGHSTFKSIMTYSILHQTVIIFAYLFIGTIIIDFVWIQPRRSTVLAS
ncbi:hypothetical protein [Spirosoma pollinicola]|uniref:Uncharacterized protein n=1 Tax=Spirosoma pollinicola TaxID=2057025 RepID=A0A2K8Z4A0_9BACT|nr:hypothetical protein [Spirosoma pollinicola]AUD04695.1 hypothetical protein CWM47_24315 [Spirosoma pollinicola]